MVEVITSVPQVVWAIVAAYAVTGAALLWLWGVEDAGESGRWR